MNNFLIMVANYKYSLVGIVAIFALSGLMSCSDDVEVDDWSATYAYIERVGLGANGTSYNLSHSSLGVAGDTKIAHPVSIRINRALKSDVTVNLTYAVEGDIPSEAFSFRNGKRVVIPAGETVARDTLDVVSDWDFVPEESTSYKVTIAIESLNPASGSLRVSPNLNSSLMTITKSVKADILADAVPAGAQISDRSTWVIQTSVDGTNWAARTQLTDGNLYNYVWHDTPTLFVRVDMGAVRTLTGLESICAFAPGYAMTQFALKTSEDGVTYTSTTADDSKFSITQQFRQYIKFVVPITTRYIELDGYGTSVLCSEIYSWSE